MRFDIANLLVALRDFFLLPNIPIQSYIDIFIITIIIIVIEMRSPLPPPLLPFLKLNMA